MVLLQTFNDTLSALCLMYIEYIPLWSKKNIYVGIVLNKFQIS